MIVKQLYIIIEGLTNEEKSVLTSYEKMRSILDSSIMLVFQKYPMSANLSLPFIIFISLNNYHHIT